MSQSSSMVSVIIPTHNRAAMLVEAIRSALNQSWRDLEVVVVDDASTDDTPERIPRDFPAVFARGRLRYLRNEVCEERSRVRNRGVAAARGEYVAFLDDDDLFLPRHLEVSLSALHRHEVSATGVMLVDHQRRPIRRYQYPFRGRLSPTELALLGLGITPSNAVLRREVFERAGGFRAGMNQGEDIDFFMRVALTAPIGQGREVTVLRRVHDRHYTADEAEAAQIRFLDGLRAMLLENSRKQGVHLSPRVLGYLHLYLAYNGVCRGDRAYASTQLRQACAHYPRLWFTEPYVARVLGRLGLLKNRPLYDRLRRAKHLWKHPVSAS